MVPNNGRLWKRMDLQSACGDIFIPEAYSSFFHLLNRHLSEYAPC